MSPEFVPGIRPEFARTNGNTADTLNGLNQVTATGGTSVSYGDARGNVTAIGSASYAYTSANRLYYTASGAFILYDAGGVPVNLTNASSVSTRLDMVGAQTLITEFDATQTVTRRYVHGPGQDEPLVWYEGSGTSDRRWLHADERGSIIATSNDSGSVTSVNSYDEYGVPAAGNVGRFGYTGQLWMPDLQMWYYRARIYNPTLGRFMQTDPIGYAGGINLYGYVGGDPVNFSDPSGLAKDVGCVVTGSHICVPYHGFVNSNDGPMADPGPNPLSGNRSGQAGGSNALGSAGPNDGRPPPGASPNGRWVCTTCGRGRYEMIDGELTIVVSAANWMWVADIGGVGLVTSPLAGRSGCGGPSFIATIGACYEPSTGDYDWYIGLSTARFFDYSVNYNPQSSGREFVTVSVSGLLSGASLGYDRNGNLSDLSATIAPTPGLSANMSGSQLMQIWRDNIRVFSEAAGNYVYRRVGE